MKCAICDNDATVYYSIDIDLVSIPSCDEHKEEIYVDFMLLITGDEKTIKRLNKKYGKDRTVDLEKRSRKRSK